MSKRGSMSVVLLVLLLGLAGCGLGSLTGASGGAPTQASSTVAVPVSLEAPPTSAPATNRSPAVAAQRFLLAWARPDLAYRDWWPTVAPLMNAEGQQDYATTDPAALPLLTLTGQPTVRRTPVATSTTVWQPTSYGRFGVRLTRTSPTAAWLVAALDFPPGIH